MPPNFDPPIPAVTITPYDNLSMGAGLGSTSLASTAWVSANRALYIPFRLFKAATAYKIFVVNGTAVSGNLDLGIYDRTGRRLISTGSTAQSGTNTIQEITFGTPLVLGPGPFYMAMAMDNTTGTTFRRSPGPVQMRVLGMFQEASAFALPVTATFATISTSYVPMMGIRFFNG